jgi:hypothetical protein
MNRSVENEEKRITRKLVLILTVLPILPVADFSDLGVGAAAFWKSPVLLGQPIGPGNLNAYLDPGLALDVAILFLTRVGIAGTVLPNGV